MKAIAAFVIVIIASVENARILEEFSLTNAKMDRRQLAPPSSWGKTDRSETDAQFKLDVGIQQYISLSHWDQQFSEQDIQVADWLDAHVDPLTGLLLRNSAKQNYEAALIETSSRTTSGSPWDDLVFTVGLLSKATYRDLIFGGRRRHGKTFEPFDLAVKPAIPKECPDEIQVCKDYAKYCVKNISEDTIRKFIARYCPMTCGTPQRKSYCNKDPNLAAVGFGSPCKDNFPCRGGYRPAEHCRLPFSNHSQGNVSCIGGRCLDVNKKWHKCWKCKEKLSPEWEPLVAKLRCFEIAVALGDAKSGSSFEFENMGVSLTKPRPFLSAGKWPAAVLLATAVRDQILDWDTRACDVFEWWSSDAADARSQVTFHDIMSFASGFIIGSNMSSIPFTHLTHRGWVQRCLTIGWSKEYTPEQCAKQIYDTAHFVGKSGTLRFRDYNSYHLTLALAMVMRRSGITDAQAFIKDKLLLPLNMTRSYWVGGQNPLLAYGHVSSGEDRRKFLQAVLSYEILPKTVMDAVEDYPVPSVSDEFNSILLDQNETFGMAMGNFHNNAPAGCIHMSTNVLECLNRRAGMYFVVVPKPSNMVYAPAIGPDALGFLTRLWITSEISKLAGLPYFKSKP